MSQDALALQAGYDRTYIGMIENGRTSITVVALLCLSQTLGTLPSHVLSLAEEQLKEKERRGLLPSCDPKA